MTGRPRERDDLDALLNFLLPFAQQQLAKRREFYPFGNVMTVTGEITALGGYTRTEHPPSQEVIDLLIEAMQQQATAGEIRATGLCFDSRARLEDGRSTDAITSILNTWTATRYAFSSRTQKGGSPDFGLAISLQALANIAFPSPTSDDIAGH